MVFPVVGGNESKGYEISNSLRFNDGDSARLSITPSSEGNRKTHTFSTWVKRSNLTGGKQHLFGVYIDNNNHSLIRFDSGENLDIRNNLSANAYQLDTTAVFRDPSAWYHIVMATDTTQSTASDRIKLYINGVQVTLSGSYPLQNNDTFINDDVEHTLGEVSNDSEQFDGYMTETHLVDGSALAPTSFGEFDDNGVWVPIKYTGTYGTNGFFLEFKQTGTSQNSSGIGADTSGNDNHFAVSNLASTDITEDTCTNNFATINPLLTNDGSTHSEGNLKFTTPSGPGHSGASIAVNSGKWYAEFVCTAKTSVNFGVALVKVANFDGDNQANEGNNVGYFYLNDGKIYYPGGSGESYASTTTFATGDVISIAFDADNLGLKFYKNGTDLGNYTRVASENTVGADDWIFSAGEGQGSATATFVCNFGSEGSLAGTKTAGGNSDANGYGDFLYSVPSGYYAICTKNLAEFG